VADDNDTCRGVLRRYLDGLAMSLSAVPTGIDALATLRRAEHEGDPFGLLVLDADMPGMDGFALVERMRDELSSPPSVVMMLTTTQQSSGASRCRRLGIPNYVIKPVRTGRLLRALSQALTPTPDPSGPPASDPRGSAGSFPRRSLNALIAEDNAINATLMTRLLERQGHRVTCVQDGPAALDAIRAGKFDVAVLDVQMPELGGMEVAWLVRDEQKKGDRYLPMVAVTAHVVKGTRESCLKAGFDAYLSKPIRPDELYEVIDTIVPPTYGAPQQRRRRSFVGNNLVDSRFDRVTLLEHTGHDIVLAKELVELFLEEHVRWNAQMRAAIEAGDSAELQRVAHMLKGAVLHYGAQTAMDLALILERMGREGDIASAPTALDELELTIKRMIPDLEKFLRDRG
jgi:CheY-like chemotaxis protein